MSGAKNCPETPRQKMIGMMYLVLTAMLALNVSTDVLKAFKLVDDSLHSTLSTTESSNRQMMSTFRAMRDDNPQKNGEWYDKAEELTHRSDSLFNYIQDFKYRIAVQTDGAKKADPEARVIQGNDNRDAATQYALSNKNGEMPAVILKNMLVDYREYLKSLDPSRAEELDITFDVSDKQEQGDKVISWEDQMFHDMPSGAAVVLLSKMQNDVRNSQNEMIHYLMNRTDAGDLRVNKLNAYVIPSARSVVRGTKYSAQIILAALDSTQRPEFYIEGQRINDQGLYEVVASGSGLKKYSGYLSYMNPATGKMENLNFRSEYEVVEPQMTISNVDLNVLYNDFDNKLSISVPIGTPRISASGATVRQQNGLWIVRTDGKAKEVVINVSADIDGKIQAMGSQKYRIKPLPKPNAYFKSGDNEYNGEKPVPRAVMMNKNATVIASYGPDGFLEVPYEVVSFKARINGVLTESSGNKFSADQMKRIGNLDRGQSVIIEDVRAKTQAGKIVPLAPVPLTLN